MKKFCVILLLLFKSFFGVSQDISQGLVANWTFDSETGNTVTDQSSNKINGTSYNLSYVVGIKGKAAYFDSTNDEIHFPVKQGIPSELISGLKTGTISVWFKFQNLGANILPILYFGESNSGSPHNSLIIEIGHGENPSNRKLYFTIVNKNFCFDSNTNLLENQWYHFVAVVSETGNTGFLDGVEMYNRNYNLGSNKNYSDFFNDVPAKETLTLGYGRYGQNDQFFHYKGAIDDVRIYNRALSATEVKTLYQDGKYGNAPTATFENVPYGPDVRNLLDFWKASSTTPTPLVVFIHGGGFRGGDKLLIRETSGAEQIKQCLNNGVSFASIIYRFRQTTRLDSIMFDCARAIQFLRSKASEWNLDKNRFAAYGGSAGGGASLWLGVTDDWADQKSTDPVLRESSRLQALGHQTSQATYDFDQWDEILRIPSNWAETYNILEDLELYHIQSRSQINSPEIVKLRQLLDMPFHMDPKDPPMFFINVSPDTEPTNSNDIIHHPRHEKYLKAKCDQLGIFSKIVVASTPIAERISSIDFFLEQFKTTSGTSFSLRNNIKSFPNPAKTFFRIESDKKLEIIELFNIDGRKFNTFYPDKNTYTIDCTRLPKGMSVIRINRTHTEKLIIQ